MESMEIINVDFWKSKKVFVTGHTGFKGTWLCEILSLLGAEICGYSLGSDKNESIYDILNTSERVTSFEGDIRDYEHLNEVITEFGPEVVFHLAAQPIVTESYRNPRYTYDTNVMGTVNLLESIRFTDSVRSVVNVTTDKVYKNKEWCWGYRETDEINGIDPYSNSKSCSELVTSSYINSFFNKTSKSISTVRAGNVIGGGDFAKNRIIPDCFRAAISNGVIKLRNPNSVRPYQHVLEPLFAYMMIAEKQYDNRKYMGNYNVGPDLSCCVTTSFLANEFCHNWGGISWESESDIDNVHESNILKLECSKIHEVYNWMPVWDIHQTVEKTVKWYKSYYNGEKMINITNNQIFEYLSQISSIE